MDGRRALASLLTLSFVLATCSCIGQEHFSAPARRRQSRVDDSCSTFDGGIHMCSYEDHSGLKQRLRTLARRFPHLAHVGSLGLSVRGQDLLYIKISSNVSERSLGEPMFKYVGNMHGDETLGRQLLIYLAQYLLQNYGADRRVTQLVDSTEIYLVPTMNPDGFAQSSEGSCGGRGGGFFANLFNIGGRGASGRENANGKDLNRDFPKQFDEPKHLRDFDRLVQGRQPETVAMMRWIKSHPFVLSANLHAGAVVASYPYDDSRQHRNGIYSSAPDDKFFRYVASLYAKSHAFMTQGHFCGDNFPGGVTNGAQWYDVPGGMQDFNYVHSNAFEITLELSCCKHVPSRELTKEWLNNKEALLKYMEATHMGLKGLVLDENDRPIPNAEIIVHDINKVVTSTSRGEYWRLLTPGLYTVSARANGYRPSRKESVNVPSDQIWPPKPVVRHFKLSRS